MNAENSAKLAVLIDADNASADIVEVLLEEIAKYGIASVKRIYGDWSSGLKKWKDALLPHAITPVQQFAYTKGKNATDMAMVIDAMDLLYSNTFDGFCIVSSDSDFTRLASRIRENGLTVYGFGQKKTPESFRKACDKFIYTENLLGHTAAESEDAARPAAKTKRKTPAELKQDTGLVGLIRNAVKEHADDDGWASLGVVGQYINKVNSDFDARNWGYTKLSGLIRAIDLFETQIKGNHLWLRSKKRSAGGSAAKPDVQAAPEKTAATETPNTADQQQRRRGRPAKKSGQPENANAKNKTSGKPPRSSGNNVYSFSRLIPLVQQAIDAAAADNGWAKMGDVCKNLTAAAPDFVPQEHGYDSVRETIAAIYDDWIEVKKAGRGERVRVNRRYGFGNNAAATAQAAAAPTPAADTFADSTDNAADEPLTIVIPAPADDDTTHVFAVAEEPAPEAQTDGDTANDGGNDRPAE